MYIVRLSKKAALICGVSTPLLFGANAASAQSTDTTTTNQVTQVIVTAEKRAEKLSEVPLSVTAIGGTTLATQQILDLQDLTALVPGMSMESETAGWNRIILRGQNSGGFGATVSEVVDEVPVNFSGSDNNDALISSNIDTYDLKQIEVLRGPQGTLYGAAAEGGLIKYVTNPPDLQGFHAGLEAGGESIEGGQAAESVKGYVNIPFFDDKAALRISAYDEGIPGYIDNPLLDQRNVNSGYKVGFRASVLFAPISDLTVRITALNQYLQVNGDGQIEVVGAALTAASPPSNQLSPLPGRYVNNTYSDEYTRNTQELYYGDIEYDLHWAKLSSITGYGILRNAFDDDFTSADVAPGLTYGEYGDIFLYGQPISIPLHQLESLQKTSQEFRLTSDHGSRIFGKNIDWQGGVFLTKEDVIFNQIFEAESLTIPSVQLTPAAGGATLPSTYSEAAVFGQIDYHLTDQFDISAGARYTGDQESSQITLHCCVFDGPSALLPLIKSNETATTYSVAPRWRFGDDGTLYGRIATGFRPGGPNLIVPNAPPNYKFTYNSDSTVDYEVGVRDTFLDRKFAIDIDAYYIVWSDIQIEEIVNGYGVIGNGGGAVSKGFEWNFDWTPIGNLTVSDVGAYTDAYLTTNAPAFGGFAGQALAYVPRYSNSLNVDYHWHAFQDYDAFVGGTFSYVGSRYTDFGAPSATSVNHVLLPGYETLGLRAGLKNGKYLVELYAKNVSNTRAITYYLSSGGYDQTGLAGIIQPATYGIRVATDF